MEPAVIILSVFGGVFGGVSLVMWTNAKTKIARILAEKSAAQAGSRDETVLAAIKALQQRIETMETTSHEFDLSFDASLGRLEGRVDRLESKVAGAAKVSGSPETPQILRSGPQST